MHDAPGGDGGVATGVERFPQGAAREGERHGGRDEGRGADRDAPATPPPPCDPAHAIERAGPGHDVRRPPVEELAHFGIEQVVHRYSSSCVSSSGRRLARARWRRTRTVTGEMPRTAAASSSVMPSHSTMTSASR